jgi:hypothetical protein
MAEAGSFWTTLPGIITAIGGIIIAIATLVTALHGAGMWPPSTTQSVSISSPKSNENVKLTSDSDGSVYKFPINGISSGVSNSNSELLLWIRSINPPVEGWYLQQGSFYGVQTINENGAWTGIAQVGSPQYPPHTGDRFDLAVTIADSGTINRLKEQKGVVVEESLFRMPSDVATNLKVEL